MGVVGDLLVGTVERIVGDVAIIFRHLPRLHQLFLPEALLVVVEFHRLVRELQHVLPKPMDERVPDAVIESALELRA